MPTLAARPNDDHRTRPAGKGEGVPARNNWTISLMDKLLWFVTLTPVLTLDHEKGHYIIGRHSECDARIDHPDVSRFHAMIKRDDTMAGDIRWYLMDLGSEHGLQINSRLCKKGQWYNLQHGDVVKLTRTIVLTVG